MKITRRPPPTDNPVTAPRRKAVPVLKRPLVRLSLISITFTLVASAATWAWASGTVRNLYQTVERQAVTLSSQAGFTVRDILITGRYEASKTDLRQALGLIKGMPLLTFAPQSARARIEALPWVKTATVERRLPDIVFVTLTERTPMALWQFDGKFALIDDRGETIDGADLSRFGQLPLVVGADAPKHASQVIALMKRHQSLANQVKAAVRVSARRWTLALTNGIEIHLPAQGAAAALSRLAQYHKEYEVLSRDISVIDLRVPGRLVVRKRDNTAPTAPVDAQDTRGA